MFPCILYIKTFEVVKRQIFYISKSNKTQQPLQDSRCLIYFSLYTIALHFTILNVSDTVQKRVFELLNGSWEKWMDQNYRRFLMVLRKKGDDPSSKRPRGLTFSDIDLKWSDIL